jgi:hypothetical protein
MERKVGKLDDSATAVVEADEQKQKEYVGKERRSCGSSSSACVYAMQQQEAAARSDSKKQQKQQKQQNLADGCLVARVRVRELDQNQLIRGSSYLVPYTV